MPLERKRTDAKEFVEHLNDYADTLLVQKAPGVASGFRLAAELKAKMMDRAGFSSHE